MLGVTVDGGAERLLGALGDRIQRGAWSSGVSGSCQPTRQASCTPRTLVDGDRDHPVLNARAQPPWPVPARSPRNDQAHPRHPPAPGLSPTPGTLGV